MPLLPVPGKPLIAWHLEKLAAIGRLAATYGSARDALSSVSAMWS